MHCDDDCCLKPCFQVILKMKGIRFSEKLILI